MAETALKGSFNIPGTFEVHDREGHVYSTFTSAYFKSAEAHVDLLNREDPEGGYTWTRIGEQPAQPEPPSVRPVIEHALTAYGYSPKTVQTLLDRLITEASAD